MILRRNSMTNKKENWMFQDVIDKDGYYRHNECGAILLRVDCNTNLNDCYCYCRKCHREIKLQNIVNGKIVNQHLKVRSKETA